MIKWIEIVWGDVQVFQRHLGVFRDGSGYGVSFDRESAGGMFVGA